MSSPNGHDGCRCIDVSNLLSSLVERSCDVPGGGEGVMLSVEGPCAPHAYGSARCLRHDALHDEKCDADDASRVVVPDFCLRPWCYVDLEACAQSSERVYRSDYFDHDSGIDLFYSYTTCGSTADDWLDYHQQGVIGGDVISAGVPIYSVPLMYKQSPSGDILMDTMQGMEYFDDSVPFKGIFINYLDSLMDIGNGDLNIHYTFGSNGARRVHPSSNFTALVQDIADGVRDMAIGPFWVTGERLKLVSFTVPLYYDKTTLVIPKPTSDNSLSAQTSKVLEPFTTGVWACLIALIALTALLSVWFKRHGRSFMQRKNPNRIKRSAYFRVALDEFLHNGVFFCSGGVEQNENDNLPQKILMFGFAFFILIVVATYVANLAAFLTRPVDFIRTIETVNQRGMPICAHPVLETELRVTWPTVNWVFSESDSSYYSGMIDDYKAGNCAVLALGYSSSITDAELMKSLCDMDLVFTDSLIIETPTAIPIRPGLASGMSYWMQVGEKDHGITLESATKDHDEKYPRSAQCNVEFSLEEYEASDYAKIKPVNFFFPFMFFLGFAGLAIILQIFQEMHSRKSKKEEDLNRERSNMLGRRSGLERQFTRRNMLGTSGLSKQFTEENRQPSTVDPNNQGGQDRKKGASISFADVENADKRETEHPQSPLFRAEESTDPSPKGTVTLSNIAKHDNVTISDINGNVTISDTIQNDHTNARNIDCSKDSASATSRLLP